MRKLVEWGRDLPLGTKFVVLSSVLMLGMAVVLTLANLGRERGNFQRELENQAGLVLSMSGDVMREPLYRLEIDELAKIAQVVAADEHVTSVRVYGADGQIWVAPGQPELVHTVDSVGMLLAGYPLNETYMDWQGRQLMTGMAIAVGQQRLGAIGIGFSTDRLRENMLAAGRQSLVIAGISVILGIVSIVLVARRISNPLQKLRQVAVQVSKGDLEVRLLERPGKDEVGQLSSAFNEMSRAIRERETTQKQLAHSLEQRHVELENAFKELESTTRAQRELLETVRRLAAPAVPVWRGIIVLPIVGPIDAERAGLITASLLKGIEEFDAQVAIIDITGVPEVSEQVVGILLQSTDAAELMGCQPVLTGLRPEFAQSLVALGIDPDRLVTRSDLEGGVAFALSKLGFSVGQRDRRRILEQVKA